MKWETTKIICVSASDKIVADRLGPPCHSGHLEGYTCALQDELSSLPRAATSYHLFSVPTLSSSIFRNVVPHRACASDFSGLLRVTDKQHPSMQNQNQTSGTTAQTRLTSWQADGSAALPLPEGLGVDVDVLLAQPPQAEVGRLAGLIDFVHLRAEHSPVIRHHGGKHAGHTHQQHEDGYLDLCVLVHVSRGCTS